MQDKGHSSVGHRLWSGVYCRTFIICVSLRIAHCSALSCLSGGYQFPRIDRRQCWQRRCPANIVVVNHVRCRFHDGFCGIGRNGQCHWSIPGALLRHIGNNRRRSDHHHGAAFPRCFPHRLALSRSACRRAAKACRAVRRLYHGAGFCFRLDPLRRAGAGCDPLYCRR